MIRYGLSVVTVICCSFGFALAQDDASKKDLAKLQGVWRFESMEGGFPGDATAFKDLKLTFKGNTASHAGAGGKTEEATFKLDATKKPKHIDFMPLSEPGKGKTMKGIYDIDGDTLKICGAGENEERPTEFRPTKK